MRENAYTGSMLWAAIALLALTVAFASMRASQAYSKTQRDVTQNQKSIVFICSTQSVLDNLVVTAHKLIRTAFQDGTYARLLKQGIVTRQNLRAARSTMRQYERAHLKLTNAANACRDR